MQKRFSIFIIIFFFLAGFFLINQPSKNLKAENIKEVEIAGVNIKVELALIPETQIQGLSDRQYLNNNEGMLFVFDYPDKYPFWMKSMNFAIDIIWIGKDMNVVYIKKYARPEEYPNTYIPDKDAKYILEVVAGFSDKNNLQVGDKIKFTN